MANKAVCSWRGKAGRILTRQDLAEWNVGENLDQIMNLDPRGYGVCRILYEASRAYTGKPLTLNGAELLIRTVQKGDFIFILTGFILPGFLQAETDGAIGAALLARTFVKTFEAKPVLVCPAEAADALRVLMDMWMCSKEVAIIPYSKETAEAEKQADDIMKQYGIPAAVISIEAPGANAMGEYHNATGLNVTALEAKTDILFQRFCQKGVVSLAIGDLGNEIGMGTIGKQIQRYVPYADKGACQCACRGGILAAAKADHIITATTSDWGCYGLLAALAYLKKDIRIFHTGKEEEIILKKVCENGLIDMTGPDFCGIDGFGVEMNAAIIELMRNCTEYAIQYEGKGENWFQGVIERRKEEKDV
jgi:hypothetical protein